MQMGTLFFLSCSTGVKATLESFVIWLRGHYSAFPPNGHGGGPGVPRCFFPLLARRKEDYLFSSLSPGRASVERYLQAVNLSHAVVPSIRVPLFNVTFDRTADD